MDRPVTGDGEVMQPSLVLAAGTDKLVPDGKTSRVYVHAAATMLQLSILRLIRNTGRRESDFAFQGLVAGRAAKTEHILVVALRWHSSGWNP